VPISGDSESRRYDVIADTRRRWRQSREAGDRGRGLSTGCERVGGREATRYPAELAVSLAGAVFRRGRARCAAASRRCKLIVRPRRISGGGSDASATRLHRRDHLEEWPARSRARHDRHDRIEAHHRCSGGSMIPVPAGVHVWLATGHTDMRKGFPRLALLVQEKLKTDPHSGHPVRLPRTARWTRQGDLA
jgi:IS66 Orf2 like protein